MGVVARAWLAMILWPIGEVDEATRLLDSAVTLARQSGHLLWPRAKPMNGINAPQRPDCVAGVGGLELRNVVANYPFERSHRFPGSSRIPATETIRVRAATVGGAA